MEKLDISNFPVKIEKDNEKGKNRKKIDNKTSMRYTTAQNRKKKDVELLKL